MSIGIAYGNNGDGNWFVQSLCDQDHNKLLVNENCGCESFGEKFTKEEVERKARILANKYKLHLYKF